MGDGWGRHILGSLFALGLEYQGLTFWAWRRGVAYEDVFVHAVVECSREKEIRSTCLSRYLFGG